MVRVLAAEDIRILRDTLVAVLSLESDIEVASGEGIVAGQQPRRRRRHCQQHQACLPVRTR